MFCSIEKKGNVLFNIWSFLELFVIGFYKTILTIFVGLIDAFFIIICWCHKLLFEIVLLGLLSFAALTVAKIDGKSCFDVVYSILRGTLSPVMIMNGFGINSRGKSVCERTSAPHCCFSLALFVV